MRLTRELDQIRGSIESLNKNGYKKQTLQRLFQTMETLSLNSGEDASAGGNIKKAKTRKLSANLQGVLKGKPDSFQESKSFKFRMPRLSPLERCSPKEYIGRVRSSSTALGGKKPFSKGEEEEVMELIFSKVSKRQRTVKSCSPKFYARERLEKDGRANTSCILDYALENFYLKTRKRVRCNSTMARISDRVGFGGSSIHKTRVGVEDFEIIKGLSSGAYGKVCLVKKRTSGDYFAMKIIDKEITAEKAQEDYIRSEVTIMRSVDSDFIVKLYYSFQNAHYLFFVMEYMNGGDLGNILQLFGCLEEKVLCLRR